MLDLVDARKSLLDCLSGVKGEELRLTAMLTDDCPRGEGVRGIRPPAVREEKSPLWDLIGVDTVAVAIVNDFRVCQTGGESV